MRRYTAHSENDARLFDAATAAGMHDLVIAHREAGEQPAVAYSQDTWGGAYPVYTYKPDPMGWLAEPWRSVEEARRNK